MLIETEKNKIDTIVRAKPFIVVGVPAFNEEHTIARVVLEAQKQVDVVIVCDDGSTDMTAEIAQRLGADVIRHERNLGYGAAIQSLLRRSKELEADVLVTLDADGQHEPVEIPSVVKPIIEGTADIVIGSRFFDKRLAYTMPWYRRAGVKIITRMVNGSAKNGVSDAQSGFRAYGKRALEKLSIFEDGMGASVEILLDAAKNGLMIQEVSSSCKYDNRSTIKTSTHNPVKHLVSVLQSIIRIIIEDKPLTVLGIPGIFCLSLGTVFGVWMLQLYAAKHQIETNVALASIAFVLIGFFALSTAITLYAISRLAEKTNGKR